jgi:hypothetical protein
MASSGQRSALVMLVVVVLVAGSGLAGAARPAPGERSSGMEVDSAAYVVYLPAAAVAVDKARDTVAILMGRLPAGPSRKGPGH